jgi:hypothetical protein
MTTPTTPECPPEISALIDELIDTDGYNYPSAQKQRRKCLEDAIAALAKDAARLQWIDDNYCFDGSYYDVANRSTDMDKWMFLVPKLCEEKFLRGRIDAAIEASK